ncbi:hypothetical protein VTL71DRAFT_5396 [Oculimacula yallundae]|uniref:F-box domain-containing protein n=1 Tax=Oculimacula yallundae TaxID=86028 RepID=A0ABR4C252_9HELO
MPQSVNTTTTALHSGCGIDTPLESLPPELLSPILLSLDLESLNNLLQVSSAASRLFAIRGVELFETILSSESAGNHHKYTRPLIRITCLLRSTALPPHIYDLTTLKDLIRHETTEHRYEPSRWEHLPLNLLDCPGVTTTALREVLTTYGKIQYLTMDCLQYYLAKFQPLRPSHLADPKFGFARRQWNDNVEEPWQQIRALWRTRLFYELKNTVRTFCITCPPEGISEIKRLDNINDLYDAPMDFADGDEGYWTGDGTHNVSLMALEWELIQSVTDYLSEAREPLSVSTYSRLKDKWALSPFLPSDEEEFEWNQLESSQSSTMWGFWDANSGSPYPHYDRALTPLQHVPFAPYRRLGFAIWCAERFRLYGFLTLKEDSGDPLRQHVNTSCQAAWRSILTTEERLQLEDENKRQDELLRNAPEIEEPPWDAFLEN